MTLKDATALLRQPTLSEADCRALINGDGTDDGLLDAYDILKIKMPTAARRFKNVDRAITTLLADVRKVFPDAQYYTASGGFHLLLGSPHETSINLRSQQELVALSGNAVIGDGDF